MTDLAAANARVAELEALLERCQNEAADTWQKLVQVANARVAALEAEERRYHDKLQAADEETAAALDRAEAAGREAKRAGDAFEVLAAGHIERTERAESEVASLRALLDQIRAQCTVAGGQTHVSARWLLSVLANAPLPAEQAPGDTSAP